MTISLRKALLSLLSCLLLLTISFTDIVLAAPGGTDGEYPDDYYDAVATNSIEGWPKGPAVYGKAAILMDADTGAILYSKNTETKLYPASITKIMTCLLALENSRLTDRVTFSENAIWGIERDSSHIGIRIGEVLSMEECLYGLMLESANEVSIAIAEHVAGSTEAFADMMNEKAASLGCVNTHFVTPNGLHDDEHYTCAYDMALISRAAYRNETFRKLIATRTSKVGTTNRCGEVRWLNQHHKMLHEGEYYYPACTGGKTGFTDQALNTLVTFAEKDGLKLISVIMKSVSGQIYSDTTSLLNYGFGNFAHTDIPLVTSEFSLLQDDLLMLGCPIGIPTATFSSQATIPSAANTADIRLAGSFENGNYYRKAYWNDQLVADCHVSLEPSVRKLLNSTDKTRTPSVFGTVLEPESIPLSDKKGNSSITKYLLWIIIGIIVTTIVLIMIYLRIQRNKRRRRRKRKKTNR